MANTRCPDCAGSLEPETAKGAARAVEVAIVLAGASVILYAVVALGPDEWFVWLAIILAIALWSRRQRAYRCTECGSRIEQ